jgi:hypothetical protein
MRFGHNFAIRFADCQHRLTRSELTANIKNIQISAEICKEQTQIKNADTKTLIDHLQFTECNQLHQSPSSKYGGGGARAAWRILIPPPPSGRAVVWSRYYTIDFSWHTNKSLISSILPTDLALLLQAIVTCVPEIAIYDHSSYF